MLTLLAAYLHYRSDHGSLGLHLMHRELFFVPIILAAFWFGLRGGILSALVVSLIYAPHVTQYSDPQGEVYTVISQLVTFILMGFILGWLVRRKSLYYEEKMFLDETFGRYVPQKIRTQVKKGKSILDGSICEVTVLFFKIKNIDTAIDNLPPWQVVTIINAYFSEMADIVRRYDGLMIGFSEAAFKVVFGAPVSQADHRKRGLEAALEMRKKLETVNAGFSEKGFFAIRQSIGIHSGMALGANVGSPSRQTYNIIGSVVRTAELICERCEIESLDIIASDKTIEGLREVFHSGRLAPRLQTSGDSVGLNTISHKKTVSE
jgi:class 3 adenylate cyclase